MTITRYKNYACCMHEDCPKAQNCLRYTVYGELAADCSVVHLVNPRWDAAAGEACSYFVIAQKQTVAWGIKNLYDTVPHAAAERIKAALLQKFGRTKYYRFYREEEPLSPGEQKIIKKIFVQYGIESDPVFTRYDKEYIWN